MISGELFPGTMHPPRVGRVVTGKGAGKIPRPTVYPRGKYPGAVWCPVPVAVWLFHLPPEKVLHVSDRTGTGHPPCHPTRHPAGLVFGSPVSFRPGTPPPPAGGVFLSGGGSPGRVPGAGCFTTCPPRFPCSRFRVPGSGGATTRPGCFRPVRLFDTHHRRCLSVWFAPSGVGGTRVSFPPTHPGVILPPPGTLPRIPTTTPEGVAVGVVMVPGGECFTLPGVGGSVSFPPHLCHPLTSVIVLFTGGSPIGTRYRFTCRYFPGWGRFPCFQGSVSGTATGAFRCRCPLHLPGYPSGVGAPGAVGYPPG